MLGVLQEFVGMLDLKPDERVLDVGCGIGASPKSQRSSAFHLHF